MIEISRTETRPPYSKEVIVQLCQEIYLAPDSIVNRRYQINNSYTLISWLESSSVKSVAKCTNLDLLIRSLPANLSEKALRMEITRWLNRNLPN